MTGIFDSGAGGLAALSELRRLSPSEDILFLADRQNAPYGTKAEDEILHLTEANIKRLLTAGAERVLIACCTASTVYERLPKELRASSIPIIEPAACAAALVTERSHIALIATRHTVRHGAFAEALKKADPEIRLDQYEAQELVGTAERVVSKERIGEADRALIRELLLPIKDSGADTLILGCTHFSHLRCEIEKYLTDMKIIDTAKIGARLVAEGASEGLGATVFLQP